MTSLRLFALASLSYAITGMSLVAQDWTRFRGPNGSGHATSLQLPAKLTEQDYLWRVKLPGHGHSSPVIWGGRVFITSSPEGTATRVFSCHDAATGKVLWRKDFETGAFRQHADNSFTSSTPAVDGERVYGWWASPDGSVLVALDQTDGREIWRKELGPFVAQHGAGASPIVVNGLVILNFDQEQPGSFVVAVDAKTGDQRWKLERESSSSTASTPCVIEGAKGSVPQLVLIGRTTGATGVDIPSGKALWNVPGILPRRCVASPIVTESGLIIAQCGEGSAESFVVALRPGASEEPPKKVYDLVRIGGYVPTPIAVGDLLFLFKDNGLVSCVRASDRHQLWSERVEGGFYGSPIHAQGRLYNMTKRGDLVVLNAGEKFELLARVPLGEGSHASPAASGGRLYLRTFTHLICIGK